MVLKLAEGGATLTAGIESLQVETTDLGQGLRSASNPTKISINRVQKCRNINGTLKSFMRTDNDQVPVNGIAMAHI